jgi:replication factor A1
MNAQTETAPHFETLTRALQDKIGKEIDLQELKDEFEKYLEYGVPADQAVRTLMRHHGAAAPIAPAVVQTDERTTLRACPPNVPYVNLLVRLLSLNRKTVQARGEEKEIFWGLLGDETGTASYTSWRPLEGLAKGDVIAVQGAYTKEFRNELQVNFGDRTKLEKKDASALPKTPVEWVDAQVGELKEGLRGIRVTARILDVQPRTVTVQGESKTLWGGSLADSTGKAEFTSWHDHKLVADTVVTIEGGYVRSYRGVPQLNFDSDATVKPLKGEFPSAKELAHSTTVSLGELVERGGGSDVRAVATLLEIRPGSGLVFRCPQDGCSRVLQGGHCRIHGKGEGVPDLRIKGVLDDGTGAVSVIVGRETTEALLGKNLEACIEQAKEAFRFEVVQEELEEKLTGRVYAVEGNVLSDDYGLMFLARSFIAFGEDAESVAAQLIADLPTEAY